ncbi:acyl-CoA dehydrogenase family protein [Hyphomonas sp.]|uniref:acyl-CoA dehydrogenase family protein n=1 Tax=Hyphomonas sp. TaxID=87 RepID=UPI0032EE1BF2
MRQFTEEQVLFRAAYRRFIEQEIAPHLETWREAGIVDRSAFRKAGERGFLMIWPDEQFGGMGENDFRYEQIIIEELARARCNEFYAPLHSRLVGPYLQNFGNDEQRKRFLPKCASGETILAIAMTEPGAGSDLAGMKSVSRDMGDHYLLNGSKTYISNGINADVIVVAAKLDGAESPYALNLLLVERGMDGFERGRNLKKMGQPAQDTAELFFNDVKVPKENLLGEPGKGFYYLMEGLAEERLMGAVGSAANARHAFDLTRDFVMSRQVMGEALSQKQNTQFRMAEMDAEIDMLQVYVDHCVQLHNDGRLTPNIGAKAKMLGTEIAWKMMDLGVQLHGGAGYMQEYPICRMFSDERINRILAGSSEIMRYIIGRDIFSDNYVSLLD